MSFVLDCSVAAARAFADEPSAYADDILDRLRAATAVVPVPSPFELANALLVGERRTMLTAAQSQRLCAQIAALTIVVDCTPPRQLIKPILTLGRPSGLSAYDAAYLEVATRRHLPLATLDARLRETANRHGVQVL